MGDLLALARSFELLNEARLTVRSCPSPQASMNRPEASHVRLYTCIRMRRKERTESNAAFMSAYRVLSRPYI
jgi:hypothetical protein